MWAEGDNKQRDVDVGWYEINQVMAGLCPGQRIASARWPVRSVLKWKVMGVKFHTLWDQGQTDQTQYCAINVWSGKIGSHWCARCEIQSVN